MTHDIAVYMRREDIVQRFADVLGNPGPFIGSVLMAVANDPSGKLQECTPVSIYQAAMSAASLQLSVDRSTGQAWLVPFRNNKNGTTVATLIVGYKGLYHMAMRTGKYRFINVSELHEGQTWTQDPISGYYTIEGHPSPGSKRIAWAASFELVNGFRKTIIMTVEEIHAHAQRYARYSYNRSDGAWKTNTEQMEKKTVLRKLLQDWGYLDPHDHQMLSNLAEDQDDLVDGEVVPQPMLEGMPEEEPKEPRSASQNMADLGFDEPTEEPKTIEDKLRQDAVSVYGTRQATGGQRQALLRQLEIITQGQRNLFGAYLFGKEHQSDWTDGEVLAVWKHLKVFKDKDTEEWIPNAQAVQDLRDIFNRAQAAAGQQSMFTTEEQNAK